MGRGFWTAEQQALLEELWREKISGGLIADRINARFGTDLTRSAVMGKLGRLGLVRNKQQPRLRKNSAAIRYHSTRTTPIVVKRLTPMPPSDIKPVEGGVPLLELKHNHCRAIVGKDDGFNGLARFCGAPKAPGKAWCASHLEQFTFKGRADYGYFANYSPRAGSSRTVTAST